MVAMSADRDLTNREPGKRGLIAHLFKMSQIGTYLRLCALASPMLGIAAADVQWENIKTVKGVMEVDVTIPLTTNLAIAVLPFQVTAKTPIKFTEVAHSCACLSYAPEKEWYQPGERGSVQIILVGEEIAGKVTRKAVIKTKIADREAAESYPVTFKVNAVTPFLPYAHVVTWEDGSKPTEKSVTIQVAPGMRVADFSLEKPEQKGVFNATSSVSADGQSFTVTLTPIVTDLTQLKRKPTEIMTAGYKVNYRSAEKGAAQKREYLTAMIIPRVATKK